MHRNRGYPPVSSTLSLVKAVKSEANIREIFVKEFEAKRNKDRELDKRVDDLRTRWAEFKDRIEKAFLENSSAEKERLASQVKIAENDLQEQLEKNRSICDGIECLLRIYCLIRKYNLDSQELRTRIENLVEDINKYIHKGQIVGYYSALANSFDLIHDSYIKYLNRTIECKKKLLIEDTSAKDSMIHARRLLEKDLVESKKLLDSWEGYVTAVKDLGTDDKYTSSHLKICISHYVEIYKDLAPPGEPRNIQEQVERINYIFLHMKAIIHQLDLMKNKELDKIEEE